MRGTQGREPTLSSLARRKAIERNDPEYGSCHEASRSRSYQVCSPRFPTISCSMANNHNCASFHAEVETTEHCKQFDQ